MTRRKRCNRPSHRSGLRVANPGLLLFAAAWLLAWDTTGLLRLSALCAALHELGHIAVYYLLTGRWPLVRLTLFGLRMPLRGIGWPPWKELLLAAAGPLTNLLCSCAAFLWMMWGSGYTYGGYWFASVNLIVACTNLLPFPGLDGARIVQSVWEVAHDKRMSK